MRGVNRVFIMGYLGQDPEVQLSKNGKPYARLSLATKSSWVDADGTFKETTDWHRIMVWGKKATLCKDHLQKGSPLAVEGHLSTYKTNPEGGSPQTHVSVVAQEVHFLPGRPSEHRQSPPPTP